MRRTITLLLLATLTAMAVMGQAIPAKPSPPRLVNDFASLFTANERAELEDSLVAFERATSNQIVVITVNDIDGATPGDFSLKVLRDWGVGQQGKNNGIVMLIKPRNESKGEVFIQVGYGLEGALPDSKAGRLIDREMIPSLRNRDYFMAAKNGTNAVMKSIKGEYTGTDQASDIGAGAIIAIAFFIGALIIAVIRSKKGSGGGSSGSSGGGMFPPFLGGFGGFGGGSGSGGGGGGFGGFGGGGGGGGGGGRSF